MKRERIILHIDLNSFFASCEQQEIPELRGWPVGVVQDSGKRSVIIGSSREAKMIGIGTGASVWEAKKIYPQVKIVPANFDRYIRYSRVFRKLCSYYSDRVEVSSVDELFLDVTRTRPLLASSFPECLGYSIPGMEITRHSGSKSALQIALAIKERLKVEVGSQFSCSIGIAPNKMLTKLASASQKPDGLVVVEQSKKLEFLDQFELWHICGIGERIERRMNRLGIFTIKQLRQVPMEALRQKFGVMGEVYWHWAWGEDTSKVVSYGEVEPEKSFGNQVTLPEDVREEKEIFRVLLNLSWQVAARMRQKGTGGKTVTLWLRGKKKPQNLTDSLSAVYKPLREWITQDTSGWWGQRQRTFTKGLATAYEIYEAVKVIYKEMRWDRPVRFVGVSVSNLISLSLIPLSLFSDEMKQERAASAWDKVAKKYGPFFLRPAALMIGRIKESHLNGFTKRF